MFSWVLNMLIYGSWHWSVSITPHVRTVNLPRELNHQYWQEILYGQCYGDFSPAKPWFFALLQQSFLAKATGTRGASMVSPFGKLFTQTPEIFNPVQQCFWQGWCLLRATRRFWRHSWRYDDFDGMAGFQAWLCTWNKWTLQKQCRLLSNEGAMQIS